VEVYVIAEVADGLRLQLLPDEAEREAFLVKFYAQGDEPGVTQVSVGVLLKDLIRRFGPSRY
ncbi:MAG: hypothetical protein HUJ24_01275, partial [Rhodobacteraceae bacterium]|nr:hypothetical protein [Paracoccaceae bacterium]